MNAFSIATDVIAGAATVASLPLLSELCFLSAASLVKTKQPAATGCRRKLTVIIPAHNEQVLIERCVQSLLASASDSERIVVVAHNCSDDTAYVAAAAGAEVWQFNESSGGGKGAAVRYGFTHALADGADAVVVVDADSEVDANFLPAIANSFANGADAVQARYEVANGNESERSRLLHLSFLGINVVRPLGRARLGISCGIFGNGFGVTRETLAEVPFDALSLVEDLEYHLMLVRAGKKVQYIDEARVYAEMPNNTAAAASQSARWEGGRSRTRRTLVPRLAKDVLCGHFGSIEVLIDQLSLPIASVTVMFVIAALMPHRWSHIYGLAGIAVLAAHVLIAAYHSANPKEALVALFYAPKHILFKIYTVLHRRRARQNGMPWLRTARNAQQQVFEMQTQPSMPSTMLGNRAV